MTDGVRVGGWRAAGGGAVREEELVSFSQRWEAVRAGGPVLDMLALQVIIDDMYKVHGTYTGERHQHGPGMHARG